MVPCDPNHRPSFVLCVCLSAWMVVTLDNCFPAYLCACLSGWSSLCLLVFLSAFLPSCPYGRTLRACLLVYTYLSAWLSNGRPLGCLDGPHLGCLGGGHLGCLPSCLVARLPVSLAGRPHQCLYPRTPQVDFHCRNDMPRSAVCITPGTTTGRGETVERLMYALI